MQKRRIAIVLFFSLTASFTLVSGANGSDTMLVTFTTGEEVAPKVSISQIRPRNYLNVSIVLPPCSIAGATDCISEVSYQNPNSERWISGTYKEPIPITFASDQTYYVPSMDPVSTKANDIAGIPLGSRSGVWNFAGLNNDQGSDFMVTFSSFGVEKSVNEPTIWNSYKADITPISYYFQSPSPYPQDPKTFCHWIQKPVKPDLGIFCLKRQEFAGNPIFKMTVKLDATKNAISANPWVFSRTQNTNISILQKNNTVEYVMEGSPISFTDAAITLLRDDQSYAHWIEAMNKAEPGYEYPGGKSDFVQTEQADYQAQTPLAIPYFQALSSFYNFFPFVQSFTDQPFSKDYQKTFWQFSPNKYAMSAIDPCISGKVFAGSVSTNASLFQPLPPVWSDVNKTLDYQVASPHLKGDGTNFYGDYELILDEGVAKCLWGSEAVTNSARATVTILNNDGTSQVATSIFKVSQGTVIFKVSGFSYSSHHIQVKLAKSGEKIVNSSIPKPTPTITCIKGKETKKITALKPVCPKGYKKK